MKTTKNAAKKRAADVSAIVNLSLIAIWCISLLASLTQIEAFSVIFLFAYIAAAVAATVFVVISVLSLIRKKPFSRSLIISTYVVDAVWTVILVFVVKNMSLMFSTLL